MRASVVVFPGSNCDRDAAVALRNVTGSAPRMVWHGDSELPQSDLIVLPGAVHKMVPTRPGDVFRAEYAHLGAVTVRFSKDGSA